MDIIFTCGVSSMLCLFKPFSLIAAIGLVLTCSYSSHADIITNFDGLAAGTVTASQLDTVTTGGTWFFGTQQSPVFTISEDNIAPVTGDRAFLVDAGGGTNPLAILTADLGSEVDLTTNDALWNFTTSLPRSGNDKGLNYEFRDIAGTVAANLIWNHGSSTLSLNGETVALPTAELFQNSNIGQIWNEEAAGVHDVSVLFSGTDVTVNFGNTPALTAAILNGVDEIGSLRIRRTGSSNAAKGVFLDNVSLTTIAVPEPSSAIALVAVGLVGLVRRRRK